MTLVEKITKYYSKGIYKDAHVAAFVRAGKITADDYKAITGKKYVA